MLSIDKPPPPDPLPFQQLKIVNIKDDEIRPCDQNLPNLPEEDLSNTAVPDQSPIIILPNFSLRDYVFDTRNKDIRSNWPFSLKNLQLCLKHGVKDLLPPFQSPDCVRNQQLAECGGVSSTSEFRNTSVSHGEFSGPKEHIELDTSDAKLDEKQVISTCIESSSCRFEGENGFFSTLTSILQPQKEWGSTSGPSSSSLKIDNLLETLTKVETTGFPGSKKNKIEIKTSGKRCKIIRKSTNHVDQTSAADIATSIGTIAESMVSKVCPVCKTFSSSSNTTLNAHIDQCLSVASTSKCSSDSKLTRYRIKPRKTKLMVDIYATARTCTLEELDRRNGTAWATLSSFPAQDIENARTNTNGGKKQKVMPVHPEDIGNNDGTVYIDANGTKLRILSKFSSPSSLPKLQDDLDSRELRSEVKARKLHSAKKKQVHASKHHKYFKVAAQGRKSSSQKCISQVEEGHNQRKAGSNCLGVHKITKQVKPHASGRMLRQWACSKRTGASKSIRKEGYQPSTFKWHVSRSTAVDTDRSVSAVPFLERQSQVQNQSNFSEHCVSSPESSEQTDDADYEVCISDKREWSPVKRNLRSSFSGEMVDSGSPTQMKKFTSHPSKGSRFFGSNYLVKPQNTNGKIIKDYQSSDFPSGSNKLSRKYHANALKARKLNSSGRKEILVSSRSSTGSKSPQKRDHFGTQAEKGIIVRRSNFDHNHCSSDVSIESDQSAKGEVTEVISLKVSRELQNRSNRQAMSKVIAALSSSDLEPECDGSDGENMVSHVRIRAGFQEKIKGLELGSQENSFHEDVCVDSSSRLAPKESFMCFCKSIDPQFQKTSGNAKTHRGMLQLTQNCSCSFYGLDGEKVGFSESSFGHAQEMFFTDEDCSAMIGHGVQRELDSEVKRGSSCFEVDPISIPGPPGSFLPSPPRDMRSDEYQGKSSLSNSWVHSYQDQHDLIDVDSSGSLVSATSTISNSTTSRSCLKHNDPSSVSSDVFDEKLGSVSQNAGELPCVVKDAGLPHVVCTRDGKINGEMFINQLSVEKGTLGIANDGPPCCCQRVDRASQGNNVTYQELQPTKNHSCTLETRPAMNVKPNSLDIMYEGPTLSNCRHAMPEYMGLPVDKSPFKSDPVYGFSDPGLKFSRRNCEPASPVTSNSVLRLMGKNLMVVNKEEEDVAMPFKQPQPHPQLNHVSTQVTSFSGGYSQNVQNKASCSFPYWTHQDSSKDLSVGNVLGQSLDVGLLKNMPSSHVREPATSFLKQQTDGGHTASQVYKGDYANEVSNRPERKQSKAATCNTSRAFKMSDHQQMNSLSASNAIKEIDEIARGGNTLHVNPFYCTQPKDASNLDKPTTIHNSSFQSAAPSRKDHTSPVKWDCSSESSYVCRRGVF